MTTQEIKPTEEEQIEAELIQRILTGDWTPGQVATFEALHDPEFTPDEVYISGLNTEIERLNAVVDNYRDEVKKAAEEFEKQDKVISLLDQQLCEARAEIERLKTGNVFHCGCSFYTDGDFFHWDRCDDHSNIYNLQRQLNAAKTALVNEQGLRRQIGRLIKSWRKEASGHYCQTYNTGLGQGLNSAADELGAYMVEWKTEAAE